MTANLADRAVARRSRIALALACAALALAGCSSTGGQPGAASASQAERAWRGREGVQEAIAMLHRGEQDAARRRLMTVLRRDPADAIARQLIGQIDGDPQQMLGARSYRYTLRDGETLSTVAQRALGNPLSFYILARYNNIAVPNLVVAGQTISVPGRAPAPPAERRPQPRPAPSRPRADAPAATPSPPAAQPSANPARAGRLRAQGLAALNAGAVDRAVALLRQALAADPGNATIRGDLARAVRVQGTVRSRR